MSVRNIIKFGNFVKKNGPFHSTKLLWQFHILKKVYCTSANIDAARFNFSHLTFADIRYPIKIRPKTSDSLVAWDIFVKELYDLTSFDVSPKVIVDAGANVGFASIYFANHYPSARIYSIEPEDENYQMLVENTKRYPKITNLKAALWPTTEDLMIVNSAAESWAFQVAIVKEKSNQSIQAITIPDLLSSQRIDHIDVLKLDIEGAEKQLFEYGSEKWLDRVHLIIGETHDRYVPGCKATIARISSRCGFKCIQNNNEFLMYNPEYVRAKH